MYSFIESNVQIPYFLKTKLKHTQHFSCCKIETETILRLDGVSSRGDLRAMIPSVQALNCSFKFDLPVIKCTGKKYILVKQIANHKVCTGNSIHASF